MRAGSSAIAFLTEIGKICSKHSLRDAPDRSKSADTTSGALSRGQDPKWTRLALEAALLAALSLTWNTRQG